MGTSNNAGSATSDENGLFGFDSLPAQTYFLQVSKVGYRPTQQSAEVVAGEGADSEPTQRPCRTRSLRLRYAAVLLPGHNAAVSVDGTSGIESALVMGVMMSVTSEVSDRPLPQRRHGAPRHRDRRWQRRRPTPRAARPHAPRDREKLPAHMSPRFGAAICQLEVRIDASIERHAAADDRV